MEDPHKALVPLNTLQKQGQVFTPNKVLSSTHEMTDPGTRSEILPDQRNRQKRRRIHNGKSCLIAEKPRPP
jgi:hypothetical protein